MMEMTAPYSRVLTLASTLKAAGKNGERIVEGMASTAGVDESREIVLPEAFTEGLAKFFQHPIYTLNHDWSDPIGKVLEADVRDDGLFVKARLMKAGTNATADKAWALIEQEVINAQSIGFDSAGGDGKPPGYMDEDKGIWVWSRIQLREIAAVPLPANYGTTLRIAKGLGLDTALPSAAPKLLPVAPLDYDWDPVAAAKRVRAWADGDEARVDRAFVGQQWYPIADVIDGELKATWPGVASAMARAVTAKDNPQRDAQTKLLAAYYAQFEREAPDIADGLDAETKATYEEVEFHANARSLTGLAESVANIAGHWRKDGRELSAASRDLLSKARDTLADALQDNAEPEGGAGQCAPQLSLKAVQSQTSSKTPKLKLNH